MRSEPEEPGRLENDPPERIAIRVSYHGIYAALAGCREESFELQPACTISEALARVAQRRPGLSQALFLRSGEIAPYARVVLNGAPKAGCDLSGGLSDGDDVALLPALSGGAAVQAGAMPRGDTSPARALLRRYPPLEVARIAPDQGCKEAAHFGLPRVRWGHPARRSLPRPP